MRDTLVLGGTGLLGTAIKEERPNWMYVNSSFVDLRDSEQTKKMIGEFTKNGGTKVLNLAARVGGIKLNTDHQLLMFYENVNINYNVIQACMEFGVEKLSTALSTCIFPDYPVEKYPITEEDFYGAKLPISNLGYAVAKRSAYELTLVARQLGFNYTAFAPTNLFGPHDNFHPDHSHLVAAIVRRVYEATEGDTLEFWGIPDTLRQHLYSKDAAKAVVSVFENYSGELPLIVTSEKNIKNIEIIEMVIKASGKELGFVFNGKYPGQFRKDCSNSLMKQYVPDFNETPLEDALRETYYWYAAKQSLT